MSNLPYPTRPGTFPFPADDEEHRPDPEFTQPYPPSTTSNAPYPNHAFSSGGDAPYVPSMGYGPASGYGTQPLGPYPPINPASPYPVNPVGYPYSSDVMTGYPPPPNAGPYGSFPSVPTPPSNSHLPYSPVVQPYAVYPSAAELPSNPAASEPGYAPGYAPQPGMENVRYNDAPGLGSKFMSKGLQKALGSGAKIAEDALNRYMPTGTQSQDRTQSGYNANQSHGFPIPKMPNVFRQTRESSVQHFRDQNYESIQKDCQRSGRPFEDPEFPASNSLLVDDNSQYIVSYFGRSRFDNSIQWLRPQEICDQLGLNRGPKMFVGELDRFDINQGEIGNCWFLAAMANLAESEQCFSKVVPPNQDFGPGYCGIFRFRFWRFGEWLEVVIDDRLPTRNGELIYLRSVDKNEFWSSLLEKAYAKLHGSYKALEGGLTIEAAVDFSGGIPEMISLQETKMAPERLFYIMSKADARGAFMGCALNKENASEAQRKGLQARHAYTLTKVVEIRSSNVRAGIPLVRLRNPHGNSKEWRGDWSDDDRNWKAIPSNMRKTLGLTFEDDGEFYMSFRDFLKYFGELEICHLTPEALDVGDNERKFDVFHFLGEWKRNFSAGGCGNEGMNAFAMNPQFFINLSDPDPYDEETQCPMIVSLCQRQKTRKTEHAIGFKVYQCDLDTKTLDERYLKTHNSMERTDTFINLRELSKRMVLPAGRYCIIPCTFKRGDEGEFLLRIFVERRWGSSEHGKGQAVMASMDGKQRVIPADIGGFSDRLSNLSIGGASRSDDPGMAPSAPSKSSNPKKNKRDKIVGFALKKLEQNFPQHTRGLRALQSFYNWATDRDSEFDLLKTIVKSI
ncbi:calpain-9-like isoform X3 [Tigriopus californicus]|uniref:calpain-9-like isoform X3 n=1 Tax=Tigriopus californicus TaxID=6832 RepID=UPI0027DA42DA|nr:calpain-9-like isoform X3 [Tigriopus californicus]